MLLTNHAKERIIKRLSKRRRLDLVYSSILKFLESANEIKINEKIIIFTDGKKSLVCTKLPSKILTKNETEKIKKIEDSYECIFWGKEKFARVTTPKKFLNSITEEGFYFYLNREKKVLYIGSTQPLLAITFRPAKKDERNLFISLKA
ncbi:hypothetical protein K1720_06775 [Thermococcus argininiproducens]|uniref:Uncharacterized protein n=1 Tax=Thermococcus argininiproducens TaxID=2866384 RepID=A0A9E7SCC8_9EURY|nr:hypothetical protein [Thermococcus argininiproducens]USG99246.1 hypothetical protein K1720_06775 [Thermococcus argininiproducens]